MKEQIKRLIVVAYWKAMAALRYERAKGGRAESVQAIGSNAWASVSRQQRHCGGI